MSDLRDLYQETILDHGKKPRNFSTMDDADCHADGHNPLCGDRLTVYVKTKDGSIEDVTFQGNGCAISMASASMMSQALKGMPIEQAERVFQAFHDLVTGKTDDSAEGLGKLLVFSGVQEFPVRVKCATLPWHTLRAALERDAEQKAGPVTTE